MSQIGTSQTKHHFDVIKASGSFANTAAVLAGFAFAAVVLLAQSERVIDESMRTAFGMMTTAFLIAFAGFIVSAVIYGLVSGEEILAPRSYAMTFLASLVLAIAVIYLFWALVILSKIFLNLSTRAASLAVWLFGSVMLMATTYLAVSTFDPIVKYDGLELRQIPFRVIAEQCTPAYMPIVLATAGRLLWGSRLRLLASGYFDLILLLSLACILAAAVWAVCLGSSSHRFRIRPAMSSGALFLQSLIAAFLLIVL